jgi:hypothetical protein
MCTGRPIAALFFEFALCSLFQTTNGSFSNTESGVLCNAKRKNLENLLFMMLVLEGFPECGWMAEVSPWSKHHVSPLPNSQNSACDWQFRSLIFLGDGKGEAFCAVLILLLLCCCTSSEPCMGL